MISSQFLKELIPQAQKAQKQTGIAASAMMAQAILESDWGRSGLAQRAHNLFGIKADSSWRGPTVDYHTYEYEAGVKVRVMAKWRSYSDWESSIEDHAKFLEDNPRYAPALAVKDQPEAFCHQLQACGYATDPNYAALLISIIHGRNLTQYDII